MNQRWSGAKVLVRKHGFTGLPVWFQKSNAHMEGTLDKVMIPITPWNRLPKESDVSLQHLKSTQTRAQVLAFLGHSVSVHVNSQCSTTLVTQSSQYHMDIDHSLTCFFRTAVSQSCFLWSSHLMCIISDVLVVYGPLYMMGSRCWEANWALCLSSPWLSEIWYSLARP